MIGVIVVGGGVPRVVGDVGCAASFDVPVAFERADPVSMRDVFDGRERALLPALHRAGRALVDRGAAVLATTCGLLTSVHRELTDRLGVPVATSALSQLPHLLGALPADRRIGVVTALAEHLTPHRIAAAGVAPDQRHRIVAIDLAATDHFLPALRGERDTLDVARAEHEIRTIVAGAVGGTAIGALVSECANLPPYSAALRAATGLPVWDAMDQIRWLAAGVGLG